MGKEWKTDNGVTITPNLRVFTNDWMWGTVEASQFTKDGQHYPSGYNGEWFDGWFDVVLDIGGTRTYNGERMTTRTIQECKWFLACPNMSTRTLTHPVHKRVNACDSCAKLANAHPDDMCGECGMCERNACDLHTLCYC